jgi:hypothetical protein
LASSINIAVKVGRGVGGTEALTQDSETGIWSAGKQYGDCHLPTVLPRQDSAMVAPVDQGVVRDSLLTGTKAVISVNAKHPVNCKAYYFISKALGHNLALLLAAGM